MPGFLAACWLVWMAVTAIQPSHALAAGFRTIPSTNTIPYVPTRHDAVKDLLWLA